MSPRPARPSLLLGSLLAALLVAACAAPAPSRDRTQAEQRPRSAERKQVTAAIFSEPPTFAPPLNPANAAGADALEDLVNSGLTIIDRRGVRVARLAEAVPSVENGLWKVLPDGRMETTWKLRSGVFWHDGAPFTSADLVFTATVNRDKEAVEFYGTTYDLVEAVEAPDPLTLLVRWARPYIDADGLLAWPMPQHLVGKAYLDDKPGFTALPFWREHYVGTGPFRLRDWVKGSHVVLEAYDRYVLGRPKVDELVVKFFLDANTLLANLLAGTVEVTMGRGLSLEQALQLREQWREGRVETSPANAVHIWPQLLNPTPPVVGDVRFRRALLHAVDRQQILETLEAGMSTVAHAWVHPNDPEYPLVEKDVLRYEYDPRRSAQLVEEIGYSRGPDTLFRDAAGQRLSVEIRTTESNDIQPKSMFSVADYWQRVGVTVEPVIVPRQRAQEREYRAKFPAFELVRGGSELGSFKRLRTSELRTPENRYSGGNYPSYSNPELDALIERFLSTIARPERMQVAGQIIRHMTERVIVLGLFYDTEATAISDRLVGPTARHKGSTQAWNAHEWDVRGG